MRFIFFQQNSLTITLGILTLCFWLNWNLSKVFYYVTFSLCLVRKEKENFTTSTKKIKFLQNHLVVSIIYKKPSTLSKERSSLWWSMFRNVINFDLISQTLIRFWFSNPAREYERNAFFHNSQYTIIKKQ